MGTVRVQLPDGNIGEFPASMSQDQIQGVLAKQFPAPPPGFPENLGHAFGIGKDEMQQAKAHPISTAMQMNPGVGPLIGAFRGAKRIGGELEQAGESLGRGNPAEAAVHGITALPFVGPALNKMADEAPATKPGQSYMSKVWADATPGNIGTGLGAAAQVAPLLLGGADMAAPERPLLGRIPTRAHAGELLEKVRQEVNRPRTPPTITPRGYLMPPQEEIPLHEQPFTAGRESEPIRLTQVDRPQRLMLQAPSASTPMAPGLQDIFPERLASGDTGIRPTEFGDHPGIGQAQYIGETPGTMGGRQPLQGVMRPARPPMSPSAPPMPEPSFVNQVKLNRALPLLEKAQRLSEQGHGTITPLDSLYKRINTINPVDYDEAFSRNSALGNLTGEDRMRATPTLKAAAKQVHRAFGQDIGDVAEQAGVGKQYKQGMTEYRRASQIADAADRLKKYAVPAALGTAGLGAGYKLLHAFRER